MDSNPIKIIEDFQESSIEQINLDVKNGRSITQSQSGTESESSKDYVGRVAFEFFQNAVDRADSNIWMELVEDKNNYEFVISNDGVPFSIYKNSENNTNKKSDFYGLNSIHNGTKTAGESIGNKGVGFKSCWNVSNHVIIESIKDDEPWGFELFNPVSEDKFSEPTIKEAIQKAGGIVPSFYFPKYYESNKENFKENEVTKITIKLKDKEAYEEIKKELREFKKAHFFFLNQLKNKNEKKFKIHIKIDAEESTLQSVNKDWHIISLKDKNETLHDELQKTRKEQSYKNIPDEPNIAIAFPPENIDDENIDSKFYTYLPTKADCGFNILVHADFALDNARVSIPDNEYNKKILEIAAKLFVNELLINKEQLHCREDFAKFLIPNHKDDQFAKFVWNELKLKNKLTEILKKVYTKETHFSEKSYEIIFSAMEMFTKERGYGAWKDGYYNEIYNETIKYFCNEEIFIVYIDKENKTFLPPKKESKEYTFHLFYKSKENGDTQLDFSLLKDISNLKVSIFDPLRKEEFIRNNIVRNFSTLEILRALKDVTPSIDILKFVEQLLQSTKEELSQEVKKQLLEMKLPTKDGIKEVKYCFIDIEDEIQKLFSSEFAQVDKDNLSDINALDYFLGKIGVACNRLPYVIDNRSVQFPFRENCNYLLSNKLKEFIATSVSFLEDEVIKKLKELKWFYDEKKDKLYAPKDVFLFKSHDNRTIQSIAQEKKNNDLKELYMKFEIEEIDDTSNSNKLIQQLQRMKNEPIDLYHQDIYKKLTYQLSKVDTDKEIDIPILATDIKSNEVKYVQIKEKIVFLETKYKQYKEQLKKSYNYIVYFDTNISHEFVQKLGITVFNPNYTIEYKKDNTGKSTEVATDDELKQKLQKEFLAQFFALAEEVLGSSFEKDDAIKRWENLTIKKAYNVLLTIKDNSQTITVSSTENHDVDVLYIPLKDRYNKPTQVGEVAHDLSNPIENSNLRKFAQVFAEGIFRNQKLKSDFELYITAFLNKDDSLKKEILINKGIEENHIESMQSFIAENLLGKKQKEEVVKKLKELNVSIDDYSQIRDFKIYEELDISFDEFIQNFDEKYLNIISNLINEYKHYRQSIILQKIENNKKELEVLCFLKTKSRDEFNRKYVDIKNRKIDAFKIEDCIYQLFDVERIDKNSDKYIEALLDFENFTDKVSEIVRVTFSSNTIAANATPTTVNAKRKKESRSDEEINEKIGLGQELKIAYTFAKKIKDKKAFIEAIKEKIFENDGALKDNQNIKKYLENLEKHKDANNLDFANKVIQIASHNLDGLGYDLVIPIFGNNDEIIGIKKVELKTTTRSDNIEIHFSHNEIQRILYYMEVDNWEVWLNNEENNITKQVRDAVNKLPKELPFSFNDYILKLGINNDPL
ncbi:MAG: hypothetical protein ACQERD_12025 [Campylobacterota bacterium]